MHMLSKERRNNKIKIEDIDVEEKLARGKELLEFLLIRRKI
ncbi:hypothetical protein [Clostridium botulinum]|nr:hypothetical protein [Clostridium botulinum]